MKLARVDDAIEQCRDHLDRTQTLGSPIEAFLVRHLLVLMCATFEEEIERLVADRVSQSADSAVQEFAKSCVNQVFRSIAVKELSGFLGKFGVVCKQVFQTQVNGTRAETFYGTIVSNRHNVAHSVGANVTFVELVNSYEEAHVVLDAVRAALDAS